MSYFGIISSPTPYSPLSAEVVYTPFGTTDVIYSPVKTTDVVYSPVVTTDVLYSPYSPIAKVDRITVTSDVDSPFVPNVSSVNFTYSRPVWGVFKDLNVDPHIQKRITKMIRMKTLDKWLYEDLKEILGYFKVKSDGSVDVIDSMDQFDAKAAHKDSEKNIEKKIDFIENFFLTSRVVHKILNRYTKETNTEWVKIPHAQFYVRQLIGDRLTKMIKQAIKEKKK